MDKVTQAYRTWQRAAVRGYGTKTHYADLALVDARIKALRAAYMTAIVTDLRQKRDARLTNAT